jgi:His-Xaa-Ser system radical SAM maturase HxsB
MKAQPLDTFRAPPGYRLLPFRFGRLPEIPGEVLVTSETGEYVFLSEEDFRNLASHRLTGTEACYEDLLARHFIVEAGAEPRLDLMAAQYRSRKAYLQGGPALHLFVVTLRCDHSCVYCQVSRQSPARHEFDMSEATARQAVDRMFESPSPALTVEFQGGEPLLAFDRIRQIIEAVVERNAVERRQVRFVVATTLHLLTEPMLRYFKEREVHLSTSIDGPEDLHDGHRPNRSRDSFRRTVEALALARAVLGEEAVSALTTLTRVSLARPREIIDTYVELGFRSICLRPMSPYGFAARSSAKTGYSVEEFLAFHREALAYLIALNQAGTNLSESYTALLLRNILTPFASFYVDLRSPAGTGLGALLYNYDGGVYPSDEARMLAEMGDRRFRLGTVDTRYRDLLLSEPMRWLLAGGVAESLPGCSDCVFLPYCGADPIYAAARQQDPIGHRPTSDFCRRQTGLFRHLFELLHRKDPATLRVLLGWATQTPPSRLGPAGYSG